MKRKTTLLFFCVIFLIMLTSCTLNIDFNELFSSCEHEYTSEVIAPTCENRGYTLSTCTLCNKTKKTDYVPALGHNYTKAVTKVACTTDGYTTYTCTRCDHSYISDNIKAKGHSLTQQIVNINNEKFIKYACTECEYNHSEKVNVQSLFYGYNDLARFDNKVDLQGYYMELLKGFEEFHNSTKDIEPTQLNVNGVDTYYNILSKFNYKDYNLTADEAVGIWKLVTLDNPIFYWISNEIITGEKELYVIVYDDYVSYAKRQVINSAIEQMAVSCAATFVDNMSTKNKVKAIHDFLANRLEYAYVSGTKTPTTEKWAYSIVGAAVNKKGVCEAYSEAFTYLCTLFGIDTLIVTGVGNKEKHEWNLVCIDEKWYGMDVTWDDQGSGKIIYDYYCMSYSELITSHTADSSTSLNIDYLYILPTISQTGL